MTNFDRRTIAARQITSRTGIDEEVIERLVRRFYDKVRADSLLAPVFDARIEDWEAHLERMFAFWSSVALLTGRYHGRPMEKHQPLPVDAVHFDRWLALFRQTAYEICTQDGAEHFIERAERIAESLELGIAAGHEIRLSKGERFRHDFAQGHGTQQ